MQGHRQKVKSPQEEEKEKEETKFPLAFHAEGKKRRLELVGEADLSKGWLPTLSRCTRTQGAS